jgi:hypothetical protein
MTVSSETDERWRLLCWVTIYWLCSIVYILSSQCASAEVSIRKRSGLKKVKKTIFLTREYSSLSDQNLTWNFAHLQSLSIIQSLYNAYSWSYVDLQPQVYVTPLQLYLHRGRRACELEKCEYLSFEVHGAHWICASNLLLIIHMSITIIVHNNFVHHIFLCILWPLFNF